MPNLTSNLLHALELKSNFARQSYDKNDVEHIVLSGDMKFKSIETFLNEMYHVDHGN